VANRKREALKRHLWLNAYKLEKGCIDCGYNAHAVALEAGMPLFRHLLRNFRKLPASPNLSPNLSSTRSTRIFRRT